MLFSIVIPTYNNLSELKRCLDALSALPDGDFEVLVCIDGSTDGTLEFCQTAHFSMPMTSLVHADGKNHSRAAARNLALPHLKGKYTLFMDSDMEASPGLLKNHLELLEQGKTISLGAVQYRDVGQNSWVRYLAERGIAKFSHGEQVPSNYFITPNTAVPTSFVLELAGFDEKINQYGGEDMELGHRIFKKFKPNFVFNEKAIVNTTQAKTLDEALLQLREYGASGLRYITQKFPELSHIYLVSKCNSQKPADQFFEFLTLPTFQRLARFLIRLLPFPLQKSLISYLVVSAVHDGYRNGLRDAPLHTGS